MKKLWETETTHDVSVFDVALCSVYSKYQAPHHRASSRAWQPAELGGEHTLPKVWLHQWWFCPRFHRWWPWEKCPMGRWWPSWLGTMRTTQQSCEMLLPWWRTKWPDLMTYDLWAEVEEVGRCLLCVFIMMWKSVPRCQTYFAMKYWLTHKAIVRRITEKFGL